jgi:hypothetical protein
MRSSTRGSWAMARWKARPRTRRTWRACSAVASEGQRPEAMATRVSRIATRAGVCTCQLAEKGSASKAMSSSQGRRMSPAPSSSVVVRPAKSRSRVTIPSTITKPTTG